MKFIKNWQQFSLIFVLGIFLFSCGGSSDSPVTKEEFNKTKDLLAGNFDKNPKIESNCSYLSIDELYDLFGQEDKRTWLEANGFEFVVVEAAMSKKVKSYSDVPSDAKLFFGRCRIGQHPLDYANIVEVRDIAEGQLSYSMASKTFAWQDIRRESEAKRDPWLTVKQKPVFWQLQDELEKKGAEVKWKRFNAGGNFFWKTARFQFNHVKDRFDSERYGLEIYPLDPEGKGPINETGAQPEY